MSDKVHAGQLSKTSKELFRDGFKAFKEALKGAEGALSHNSALEAQASELLGQTSPSLAELPKILFQLSQSTSVGAVITSATGSELMANNAFYKLTRSGGGAGGASTLPKLRKNLQGEEVSPPWMNATSSSNAIFERLYCGEEGEGNGQHLDFYCQPLLAANGEFEGAFTLVADSSVEVSREDKLKELIAGVEGHIDTLKQAADELTQYLKSHGQTGAVRIAAGEEAEAQSAEASASQSESQAESVSDFKPESKSDSKSEPKSGSESKFEPKAESKSAFENKNPYEPRLPYESRSLAAQTGEVPQVPQELMVNSFIVPDPILEAEPDFDPAQLQQAVESASAFILDQEAGGAFPEAEEDDGPEDLWQEMSDGLADVLNVEDSEAAKSQDINLTILEEKPRKAKTVSADKGNEAVFKDEAGEPATCLVVDDIPVNQKLLVFQLKHFGLSIDTASSGSEALELIAKNKYAIVFMDCDMPRMSGYDTTAEIRRREHHAGTKMPVIGMTSHDRDGDKQKCLRAGMNDALPKGVSESELRKTIATALGVIEIVKPLDGVEHERNFDPQELEELISTFLYAMEMFVSSMQRAIDEKDSSLVRELASSVSGPSRVLGLHDMNKVSQEMVRLSSSGDWPQVRLKYLKLKTVYMRCQEDLRKLCPQAFSQVSATH